MYQVQVMLSCTDQNTFSARNIALLPIQGQYVICKTCGEKSKVLLVGKPYPVIEKPTPK